MRRTSGLVLAALLLSTACSGFGSSAPRTRQWAEGPVRWLLLPAEEREIQELRSDAEGRLFMDEFWRRRDPDPGVPGNPVQEAFEERVEIADRAYGDTGQRGSLTDRGRALVLLGAPSLMRHGRRKVPAWRPGQRATDRGSDRMPVRELVAETWEYGLGDLPTGLIALLEEREEAGVSLLFLLENDGSRLVDGEKYLEWAAQSLVQLVP